MTDPLWEALRRQHLEETHRASGSCPGWTCPTAQVLAALTQPAAPAEGLCDGCGASVLSLRHFEDCPFEGVTTDCPLEGVHEHAFRGPHRFREWDPADYQPAAPAEGLRLILCAEDLLDKFGTRTDEGYAITAEWGEQRPEGWYEPVFTVHYDQPMPAAPAEGPDVAERLYREYIKEPHQFVRGGGCMSKCSCGKTFSDPIHGPQSENTKALLSALEEKR